MYDSKVGIDLAEITRMESLVHNEQFLLKYFLPDEISYIHSKNLTSAQTLAGLFAAKEAVLKALGTGLAIPFHDIEIQHTQLGQPVCILHGKAAAAAGIDHRISVSITHERSYAAAICLLHDSKKVLKENCTMDAMEMIMSRHSCRSYKADMVPTEVINQIVEAGLHAPSGMNKQTSIVLTVTDKAARDTISALNAAVMNAANDPFYGAPVILTVLGKKDAGSYLQDGSAAMQNMLLAATALGLGSCWINRAKEVFATDEGKAILAKAGIDPEGYTGVAHIALGYAEVPGKAISVNEGRAFSL